MERDVDNISSMCRVLRTESACCVYSPPLKFSQDKVDLVHALSVIPTLMLLLLYCMYPHRRGSKH